jgi:hypothetical protein
MPKYIVRISKTIDASFLVEADDEEQAQESHFTMDNVVDISDGGWDVAWDVELVDDDSNIKPMTEKELQYALGEVGML